MKNACSKGAGSLHIKTSLSGCHMPLFNTGINHLKLILMSKEGVVSENLGQY
jgi:hypothetical protein